MIEAKDLRIGNSFTDCDEEKYYKVLDIELTEYNEYFVGIDKNDCIKIEGVYPIPLTLEVLEKCGFETIDSEAFKITKDDYTFNICLSKGGKGYVSINAVTTYFIEHLHQLQNLYYALTGEELTINL